MAYINNAFCWHGVVSTDVAKAAAFYTDTLGWGLQDYSFPDGDSGQMLTNQDAAFAHLASPPMPGVPSHWDNFLRVEDVDASTAAAVAHGGAVIVPAMDITPGRMSVVSSPSGAAMCLFREANPDSKNAEGGVGSVHWVELWSKDIAADTAWLKAALGFDIDTMDMPDGDYFLLKVDGEMRGGAMQSRNPEAPAMWLTWIHVEDVDATLASVTKNGGSAHTPVMHVPGVGRMAVVADNTSGVFGIITPPAA